ncbi:MAG: hypothetical protein H7Z16_09570 [Pyrinomonadaceae bacterium]|nr:hypothetical protein [Pyrinomonadaceae bacterium]
MHRSPLKPFQSFRFFTFLIAAACFALAAGSGAAQRKPGGQGGAEDPPAYHEYRGVQLGMTAADVRKKLGAPKVKSAEEDFYIFNETETAQVLYDKTEKVIAISADFMSANAAAPSAKDVFGADIEAKSDGSIHKLVRFPKAGYWLSYSRTGGADFVVTIQLQKLP